MFTQDLLIQNLIGKGIQSLKKALATEPGFDQLLDVAWPRNIAYGLNLQWPGARGIVIPHAPTMLISFHTEQIDCVWLKNTALHNPDTNIVVLYDGYVYDREYWPKNIKFIRFITWGHQLSNIIKIWGRPDSQYDLRYRISSLCHRQTQFKTYITAFLIRSLQKDLLLSWHDTGSFTNDFHVWDGTGRTRLDQLSSFIKDQKFIKADDWYDNTYNYPMQNSNWNHPAYTDSVFNCTNESFHYSLTFQDGRCITHPGPYFTEKTWKPLLAGTGIIVVGQYQTYHALEELGLKFDYGVDLSYDTIPGDLDRIEKVLDTLELLVNTDIDQLVSMKQSVSAHNSEQIFSGRFEQTCRSINSESLNLWHTMS